MKKISDRELYDFYLDTFRHCTSKLLSLSDEEIGHELFEEFDAGAHSFLHGHNLARLYRKGYISREALQDSKEIRRKWIELHAPVPSIAEIKSSNRWRDLFEHCDKLLRKLERAENGLRTEPP